MSDGLPGADVFDQQNPLDGLQIAGSTPPPQQPAPQEGGPQGGAPSDQSPLDSFGEITPSNVVPQETSAFGAAARGAERSLLPAGGSLAAAGTGAELGGAIGEVAGPIGAGVGAVVGGIGGAIAGGKAVETAQNWLLSKLPSGFVDAFGLDEAKERLDQQEHPVASFIGGLIPYAVTMSPNLAIKSAAKLPENATALQRLMSNPITAKLFGGGVMGGMELTGELEDHQDLDWRKIGIATGFGMIFNKPNRLGERIEEMGANPVRAALGRPSPTVAQAGDLKVMGPGITEQVFQGTQEQAPQAAMVAQETARAENPEPQGPDVTAVARQMEPELFAQYDELTARQNAFRQWISEYNQPSPETFFQLEDQRDALQQQLDEHIASRGGYEGGPEARKLRAQIRDVQREHDQLTQRAEQFAKGEAQETPDLSMARQHLMSTEFELRDLHSQIQAAYRRAADVAGTETVPTEPLPSTEAPAATPASEAEPQVSASTEQPAPAAPTTQQSPPIPSIAADVSQKLQAAGRPADEAAAAAQLVDAYWKTRAARFEGRKGTPEEMYAKNASDIIAGKEAAPKREVELAQRPADEGSNATEKGIRQTGEGKSLNQSDIQPVLDRLPPDIREMSQTLVQRFDRLASTRERLNQVGREVQDTIDRIGEITDHLYDVSDDLNSFTEDLKTFSEHEPDKVSLFDLASQSGGIMRQARRSKLFTINLPEDEPGEEPRFTPEQHDEIDVLQRRLQTLYPQVQHLAENYRESSRGLLKDIDSLHREVSESPHISEEDFDRLVDDIPDVEGYVALAEIETKLRNFAGDESGQELEQVANGRIRLRNFPFLVEGYKPVITLLRTANASTFIHETGHEWLGRMLTDAKDPDAPQALRDDAQTVMKWLGVDSPEAVKVRHHEKFARGFEQYMREGVAPSKGLAHVFAQFRNWLMQIYQTIKGLGKEISPEIRDVFDRMLEMEPQRTVIAPERAQPNLLHDIHEAEAATVEPHEAEATGDRIAAESQRYIADNPETVRELQSEEAKVTAERESGAAAQPAGEAGPGAGGERPLEPIGGEAGTESGGGPDGAEYGEEQPSGGAGVSEGAAGIAGPDLRSKLGDQSGTALAPGPAELFGPRESPLVDKAGNIRLDNLNVPEDVAQAIRVASQENNDFIGDRRGVITDGQVLDLADALGMDAETLNRRQLGQAFNAEQIVAARRLLVQSATTVSEAMKKAATGTDADVMAYAQAKDRHQMIQAQVAGITAEAGRALRAFRSMVGMEQAKEIGQFIQEATGKTLYQLRAEAKLGAELQTPQQVSKMMADAQKNSFGRMVLEYWINGLISGPATHMTYAVGNTISSLLRIPEQFAAAGVARAAQTLGREGVGVRPGEAGAMARGLLRSLPGAIKAGIGGLETGLTTQLPGEAAAQGNLFQQGVGAPAQFHEDATYHDAMSAAFGMIRGMRDGILATGKLLAAGGVHGEPLVGTQYSPLGAIPDIAYRGVNVLPVGSVVRAPGRFIAAIHSFYRAVNFSMEKNALAYRQATGEGLEGEALAARVAQLRADPSEQTMNEIATREATQTVLMGKGSELTQALSRLTNTPIFGFPLLKFVDPFVHISGNVIEQGVLQRTPAGLLTLFSPETELARDLTGKNGAPAQDKAIGRMLVGSALSITFGGLAAQGLMSGSGPSDPKEAAMWRQAGNQAHSVRVGDIWYSVNRLGPLGMLAGISADLFDVAHQAEHGEFLQAAAHLQHAFTQNILDESFMRGPADLIQAVEDPGRYGEAYVRNFLSSFVPFSVGMSQMSRATDPYSRQARTLTDAIKAKVPGLSETLFPRRDIWGEPMPSREVLGAPGVSAIYMTRTNNDPVNKAMLDLNIFPAQPERKIRGVELTGQEYDDYARIAGRMTKATLDRVVGSPAWNQMPVEAKHYAVQHTIEMTRNTAREMIMGKYPHIAADATTVKQKRARGEKP